MRQLKFPASRIKIDRFWK